MGVVAHQVAEPCSILQHAARHAFWALPRPILARLATERGVVVQGPSLVHLAQALVQDILQPLAPAELRRILHLRGQAPPSPIPEALTEEVLEEALTKDEVSAVEEWGNNVFFIFHVNTHRNLAIKLY
eukprot:22568-Lingulodinium_polyedra.AAC.1